MQDRIVVLQFGADEGIEIVPVEIRLRALCEVFLVIVQSVMLHRLTGVKQNFFVGASFLGLLVGGNDLGIIEAQYLVVVTVRKFVENHCRMFQHLPTRQEGARTRDVNLLRQAWIVAIGNKPAFARMILHRFEARMIVLNPNLDCLHLGELLLRYEDFDALQMIRQHRQCLGSFIGMNSIKQRRFDMDRPTFDVPRNGIKADRLYLFAVR